MSSGNLPLSGPNGRSPLVRYTVGLVVLAAASLLAWPGLLKNLFNSSFVPHAACLLYQPRLLWLHIVSDSLIGISYIAISLTLAWLVHRSRRDIPFSWILLAFGLFIIACGGTHLMDVVTLYIPLYWFSGDIKLLTAVASVATAMVLPPLVPRVLATIHQAKMSEIHKQELEEANEELQGLTVKLKEADELKTRFFANVSHELRTPLALMLGHTEKLLGSDALRTDQRLELETVHRNARSLLKQVNDLLDVSKLEAGKMQMRYANEDLARLVRCGAEHFEELAADRRMRFKVEAPESLPAQVDAEKIERIVVNLLSNAFKFTPEGGIVRCELRRNGNYGELEISDNGTGVNPEIREAIFERFRQGDGGPTRRFGGTGLGLAIVKDFVELHGGRVSAGESVESGARFLVELPLRAPAATEIHLAPASPLASEETAKLEIEQLQPAEVDPLETSDGGVGTQGSAPLALIVEDNAEMNRYICDTLAGEYRIASAANGREGLEKALALNPDVIIADIMMPEMSGDQLVRELRKHPEFDSTPIILLTAKADRDLRVNALRDGAQDYILKPFSVEELRARVRNLVSLTAARKTLQEELNSRSKDIQELVQEITSHKRRLQASVDALHQEFSQRQRLEEVRAQLAAIVESSGDAIVGKALDGTITTWNQGAEQMYGYTAEEIIGRPIWVLSPPHRTAEMPELLRRLQRGEHIEHLETVRVRKDGRPLEVALTISPIRNAAGEVIGASTIARDITERKRAEGVLRNSEKLATVGRLAATIAHEINNPLESVTNILYLLDAQPALDGTAHEYLRLAEQELARITHIVKQTLGFYRESPMPVPVSIPELLDNVLDLYARKLQRCNVRVERRYEVSKEITAYPGEMRQVLSNLVTNALEAMETGGSLRLHVFSSHDWRNPHRRGVRIVIADTGTGIPSQTRAQMFEPFFTTKGEKGTGLGLWVSQGIVHKHGGTIHVRSSIRPGRSGTVFSVFLPAEVGPAEQARSHSDAA